MSRSKGPVVAVVGSTGYVGKALMPAFLEGLKTGKLEELRVLTAEEKLNSPVVQGYIASGAKVCTLFMQKLHSNCKINRLLR